MELSFVSLKGGGLLVGRGPKTFLKEPHPEKPSWYSPDFFLTTPTPWFTHETYEVLERLHFPTQPISLKEPACFKPMYDDMTLKKGVVYTSAPCENFDWKSVTQNLCDKASHLYLYGTEGLIGATPELLFDIERDRVHTMALAATALNRALLNQEKELEEHNIVVEAIKEALSPFGRVDIKQKETIPYGALFHTLTPIQLDSTPPFETLIQALHPTPALGAWPKQAGSDWLQKWNTLCPRHKFGAPFGYIFPEKQEARAFVAIRCVQWTPDQARPQAHLWAGVGVTAKSHFINEWQELQQKLSATAHLMGIMDKGNTTPAL